MLDKGTVNHLGKRRKIPNGEEKQQSSYAFTGEEERSIDQEDCRCS